MTLFLLGFGSWVLVWPWCSGSLLLSAHAPNLYTSWSLSYLVVTVGYGVTILEETGKPVGGIHIRLRRIGEDGSKKLLIRASLCMVIHPCLRRILHQLHTISLQA